MNKIILSIVLLVLLAPLASAQEKAPAGGQYQLGTPFEGDVRFGYRMNMTSGNPMAGEYQYQHSSVAGSALIEYDPLPNRFLFESEYLNSKDYFAEIDYSYKDILMLNLMGRSLYHNLEHYSLGQDDPATPSPYFTDLSPGDTYGISNAMYRGQVRFKLPDFPFHVYLESKSQERHGTTQQRFYSSFSGGFNKLARSRNIDWETNEAKATVNSHLSWVEVEYSHATKEFKDTGTRVMTDTVPGSTISYTHNLVPQIESSVDTIKVHTSHTGRIAATATYSAGERENKDSNVKATFVNAAGDLGWIPTKDVTVAVKYRHYTVDYDSPDTASVLTSLGTATAEVRNAINYTRDLMSGLVRYRITPALTLRGEYILETLNRDTWQGNPNPDMRWNLDDKITRNTLRIGATYRATSRLMLRGDISHQTADVPAGSVDTTYPDLVDQARGVVTWTPKSWFIWLLSGGIIMEERSDLGAPFTDTRKTERDRVLNSFTFLIGKKTSITPSYAFFHNKSDSPLAYTSTDGVTTSIIVETGVPYADTAHIASIAISHALADTMVFTVDAGRSWSRGSWQNSGVVPGTTGIPELSNIKLQETVANADLELQHTKALGTEFRYQIRKLDDKLDNAQDGTNQIVLATLTYKW